MAETEFNLLDEPCIRVMKKDYEIKEVCKRDSKYTKNTI